MSISKPARLSKVARDFNVSINTIVELMAQNGIYIEAKPTTKIEPQHYEILMEEFSVDVGSKEKAAYFDRRTRTGRDSIAINTSSEHEEIKADTSILQRTKVIGSIDLDNEQKESKNESISKDESFVNSSEIDSKSLESTSEVVHLDFFSENNITTLIDKTGLTNQFASDILKLLDKKGQIILQGPPGTGKSFIAKNISNIITNNDEYFSEFIQFHQSYSYNDFIEGLKMDDSGNWRLEDGVFKSFCMKAAKKPNYTFCFVIDEINRGPVSKIFGEALYLLEKRDDWIRIKGSKFQVPSNVKVIATMNTADRSLDKIDFALRRRFSFFRIKTNYSILQRHLSALIEESFASNFVQNLIKVNELISNKSGLGRDYELGVSFFMSDLISNKEDFETVWLYELEPLIDEYCFSDTKFIEKVRKTLFHGH